MSTRFSQSGGRAALKVEFDMHAAASARRNIMALTRDAGKIEQRAIGTLRRRLPVQARRDIQQEYSIKAQRLREDLKVRDTPNGLSLLGEWRGGIGIRHFAGTRLLKKGGLSASPIKGKRKLYPSAFMARLLPGRDGKPGNVHIVQRKGAARPMTAGRYKGLRKQPIEPIYGPTAAQMLAARGRPDRLAEFSEGILLKEIERLQKMYSKP